MSGKIAFLLKSARVFGVAALVGSIAAANGIVLAAQTKTEVHDTSALKPPAGARVAIVEFEDMECPVCGSDNPTLKKAAATYKIPWIRHDFPLHQHVWSSQAAVNARWFDTKSKKMGDDYRDAIFSSQSSIYNLDALSGFTQKFAKDHGVSMPFAIDPSGKLAADVKADYDLGVRIGIDHTPTVWVVTKDGKGAPFTEVKTNMADLYQTIDQALEDTKDAATPTAKRKTAIRQAGN